MMTWSRIDTNQGTFPVGDYQGILLLLRFDSTVCGPSGSTVAGTTYDPTNHYTTSLEWNTKAAILQAGGTVTGTTLMDACGFRRIVQAINIGESSSATAKASAANTASGNVRCSWSASTGAFILTMNGNGVATDPTAMKAEAELDTTAAALAPLQFIMLVIGR